MIILENVGHFIERKKIVSLIFHFFLFEKPRVLLTGAYTNKIIISSLDVKRSF